MIIPVKTEVRFIDRIRVVALPHQGAYPEIGGSFGKLMELVKQHRIPLNNTLAIYYDDPESTQVENLRSDACMVVDSDYSIMDSPMRVVDIPEGTYLVATYKGPYSGLSAAWNWVCGPGVAQMGMDLGMGYFYERYMNDCTVVPESELLTEIVVPIR